MSLSFLLEAIFERRVCALGVPDISQYSLSKKNITYDNGRSSLKATLPQRKRHKEEGEKVIEIIESQRKQQGTVILASGALGWC